MHNLSNDSLQLIHFWCHIAARPNTAFRVDFYIPGIPETIVLQSLTGTLPVT